MTKKKIKILSLSLLGATALVVPTAITAVSCGNINNPTDGIGSKKPIIANSNLTASLLGFNPEEIAYEAKDKIINKEWIVNNIEKLVTGDYGLIDNPDDITSFNAIVKNNNQIELKFTIKGGSSYDGNKIEQSEKEISLTISQFKTVKPITIKRKEISVNEFSELDYNLSGTKAKNDINANLIFNHINDLLSGDTNYINDQSGIEYLSSNTTADATSINVAFKIKAGKSFDQSGELTKEDTEIFNFKIVGFTSPGLKPKKEININEIGLDTANFAYKEVAKITPDMIKTNIDKFVTGDTSLIKDAAASSALEVSTTISNKNTINLRIVIQSRYAYDGETGEETNVPMTFDYSFTGFNVEGLDEIQAKSEISIDDSNLSIFKKDKSITESIAEINANAGQWVIDNKLKLFSGYLDELNNPTDVKNISFTPTGPNNYTINKLQIVIELNEGISIINGVPSTIEQAQELKYIINVNDFNDSFSENTINFIKEAKLDKIINDYQPREKLGSSLDLADGIQVQMDSPPDNDGRPWATLKFPQNNKDKENLDKHKEIIIGSLFKILLHNNNNFSLKNFLQDNRLEKINDDTWSMKILAIEPKLLQCVLGLNIDNEIKLKDLMDKYGFTDINYFKIPITIIKTDSTYETVDNSLIWGSNQYYKLQIGNIISTYNINNEELFQTKLKYANNANEEGTDTPFDIKFLAKIEQILNSK